MASHNHHSQAQPDGVGASSKAVGTPLGCSPEAVDVPSTEPATLAEWLRQGPFTLALAPGFFGFYAQVGALQALSTVVELSPGANVYAASGASAGAVTAAFVAAGVPVEAMEGALLSMEREHIWDPHMLGAGLLRGDKLRAHLEHTLRSLGAATAFEGCRCPLGMSAFRVGLPPNAGTVVLSSGPLAAAISASVAVPGLFAPVSVDHPAGCGGDDGSDDESDGSSDGRSGGGRGGGGSSGGAKTVLWPLVDGAVGDPTGLAGCPGLPRSGRLLHIGFPGLPGWRSVGSPGHLDPGLLRQRRRRRGEAGGAVDMVSLVLAGTPSVGPFSMATRGPVAIAGTRHAVDEALAAPLAPPLLSTVAWAAAGCNIGGAGARSTAGPGSPCAVRYRKLVVNGGAPSAAAGAAASGSSRLAEAAAWIGRAAGIGGIGERKRPLGDDDALGDNDATETREPGVSGKRSCHSSLDDSSS